MYALHHNEEYFPEPLAFKPGRWFPEAADEGGDALKRTFCQVFSRFGVGSHSCVGKAMAYMEASLVLARVIWYIDFEWPQSAKLDRIGGGMSGGSTGRKRVDEFEIYD
jgi:cytochrome P450